MKRILLCILALLLLTGCAEDLNRENAVSTPVLKKAPIEGKWTITKCIFTEEDKVNNFKYKNMIGKDSIFSADEVIIANSYLPNPSYKIKRVNTKEFLEKKYNISKEKVGIRTENLHVIDIYDEGELFYEVLREKNDVAYVDMNGVFVQITKISDEVTDEDIESFLNYDNKEENDKKYEVYNLSENGFILGLSTPYLDPETGLMSWSYRSYFFRFLEDHVDVIMERPGLTLPKQDGFYNITVDRVWEENGFYDKVYWTGSKNEENGEIDDRNGSLSDPGVLKKIVFLSPEYINLENFDVQRGEKRTFSLNYLDPLKSKVPLALSDFVEDGEKIFSDTAKLNLPPDVAGTIDEHNIGLLRENGHWKFVGRVNFENNEQSIHKDFDVNVMIPKDMVKYDDLFVPVADIKQKLPNVIDAFTSPNNRFLITLEEGFIRVYNIEEGKINTKPVKEVKIDKGAQPVMTEWAIGRYVDLWKTHFEGEE